MSRQIDFENKCKHTSVSPDPITGDWYCVKCLKDFRQIPDMDTELPRTSTLWQRVKWAFRPRKKVIAIPHVWTVRWGNARSTENFPSEPHWTNKTNRPLFKPSPAQLAKVYSHPSMRDDTRFRVVK